jgi:gas vesicle protein
MDPRWLDAVISGASGVGGALIGGVIGARATLAVARRQEGERERQERGAALAGSFAAVNQFATTYATLSDLLPEGASLYQRLQTQIQRLGARDDMIIQRLFGVTDALWAASARVRAVATDEELKRINAVEDVIGDWQVGRPMPDDWSGRIQALGEVLQATRR